MLLRNEKEQFLRAIKKVLKRNLSQNPRTLLQYRIDTVNAFNTFSRQILRVFKEGDDKIKLESKGLYIYAIEKIREVFQRLQLTTEFPKYIGGSIDIKAVSQLLNVAENAERNTYNTTKAKLQQSLENIVDLDLSNLFDTTLGLEDNSDSEETENMALEQIDLIKLCASTIPQIYEGDPLKLTPFINSINLLYPLATTEELRTTLINFIKTKIGGKALEALSENATTIPILIQELQQKIKPESSKVIEGRLAALKTDRQSMQDFSKKAEELADSLKRCLITEGMTTQKANEITIDKTVKMCRASARTDLVKSVLASSKFSEAKEVISTFIVETGQQAEERQVLAFRAQQQNNRGFGRGRDGKYWKNNRGFNSGNNFNNYGNHRGNYRGNNRGNYRGNQRGNHRFNGSNNNNNQYYQQQNNGNVRYTMSENQQQTVPNQRGLADNRNEI